MTITRNVKRLFWIGLIIIVGFILLRVTVLKPTALEVTVHTLDRGIVEQTATNARAGTVKAGRRAKLSPEFGGTVAELPYREGESVPEGAVVLRLDDSLAQARLAVSRRDHQAALALEEQACLSSRHAQRESERNRDLSQQGIVSANLLDRLENAAETAKAGCAAARESSARAKAAINLSEKEALKYQLFAPFDAIVADLSIEVGEWTTPSPPAMAVPAVVDLLDPSSIYISAPMDEVDSGLLQLNQRVRVTIDSRPDEEFGGAIQHMAPYVLDLEQQNRTVDIEVRLDDENLAASLLPGTSADVEVILEVIEDVLRLPTQALMENDEVFVVENNQAQKRTVTIGRRNWEWVEVTDGLDQGLQVIISLDDTNLEEGVAVTAVEKAEK